MPKTEACPLKFAAHYPQETYRLLELPPELLSVVENAAATDFSLNIKGKQSDDAVLCTSSATYALKAVSVSNSFLVVGSYTQHAEDELEPQKIGLEIRGQVKEIIEVAPAVPKLDRLAALLKGNEWTGDENEDGREERPTKRRRYTYEQVSGLVQASDLELARGLRHGHILSIEGELRPLPTSQLSSILEALLTSLVLHSFSPNHVPLDAFLDAVEEDHDLPRDVVRGVLLWYGDVNSERWNVDIEALVREVGLGLLADHRDDPMDEVSFMGLWEHKVGDTFANDASMALLGGYYLPPVPPARNLTYFPHTSLPATAAARFADLFLARPRWRADDIEPFLRGLPGGEEKAGRDAMLVKFARRSEGDDGALWWTARANYT